MSFIPGLLPAAPANMSGLPPHTHALQHAHRECRVASREPHTRAPHFVQRGDACLNAGALDCEGTVREGTTR